MRAVSVGTLPTCCHEIRLQALSLLFPERHDPQGLEFVSAHGLESLTLAELRASMEYIAKGEVRIIHRCQHLRDDGRCGIYAQRPAICRAFDCATRFDCACKGTGRAF